MRPQAKRPLLWTARLGALGGCGLVLDLWRRGTIADDLALALGAAAVVALCVLVAERPLGEALLRVALAFAPLIAVTGAVIGIVIVPMEGASIESVKPALIAGVVLATGWVATFLAAEVQRKQDRLQVAEDVLHALRSEVVTILDKLDKHAIRAEGDAAQRKIRDGGDGVGAYHPFAASESPTTVYDGVKASLVVVDRRTLEPVLRFYAAFSELDALVKDFRSEDCAGLSAVRRVALHEELVKQRLNTLYWALRALQAINLALNVNAPHMIARSGKNPKVTVEGPDQ